jgi:hypothetical protein
MKEYILDTPLDEDFIRYLGNFGEVTVLTHLKAPFLSFEKPHFISIKGVIGDTVVEVRYAAGVHDLTAEYFHLLLTYYRDGRPDIGKLKRIEKTIRDKIALRLDLPPEA